MHYAIADNPDDDYYIQDDNLITGYRRRDIVKINQDPSAKDHEDLSEDIRWRLFLARQAALIVHQQKWS